MVDLSGKIDLNNFGTNRQQRPDQAQNMRSYQLSSQTEQMQANLEIIVILIRLNSCIPRSYL
jgi:hypothetical protein